MSRFLVSSVCCGKRSLFFLRSVSTAEAFATSDNEMRKMFQIFLCLSVLVRLVVTSQDALVFLSCPVGICTAASVVFMELLLWLAEIYIIQLSALAVRDVNNLE